MATWIVVVEASTTVLSFATTVIAVANNLLPYRRTSVKTKIEDSSTDDSLPRIPQCSSFGKELQKLT
jgi:hypothetical protein